MPVTDDAELREILAHDRIAVVGCSGTPGKAAHDVPRYLDRQGYEVVPVNPYADEILGRESHDSLSAVPGAVDIVDVFRPSEEVAGIVEEALDSGEAAAIWLQLGIHDDDAVERAETAGRQVVQEMCMKTTHRRLVR
jgi:predicted CoA-binding protein